MNLALLPYYTEFKVGGLFACSYIAGGLSSVLVYIFAKLFKINFSIERVLSFCFLASGAIWFFPLLPIFEKKLSDYELLGVLFATIIVIKFLYSISLKDSLKIWIAFAIVQISVYIYLPKFI